MPLLSLIIPTYNVEKYIAECIESVLVQNYKDMEIIIVDDGSTDQSGKIADTFAEKYPNVKVYHKENGGLASARNFGLDHASGKYITFLDGDDTWIKDALQKIISPGISADADMILFDHIKIHQDGSQTDVAYGKYMQSFTSKDDIVKLSQSTFTRLKDFGNGRRLTMSVCSAIFKRDIVNHRFVSEREIGSEDLLFKVQAIINSNKILYIPEALFLYRFTPGSLSNTFIFDKFARYVNLEYALERVYKDIDSLAANAWMPLAIAFYIFSIYASDISLKERKEAFRVMVKSYDWTGFKLNSDVILNPKENLMFQLICHKMWRTALMISEIYYKIK